MSRTAGIPRRRAPPSTTTTSASRPSSWASRVGRRALTQHRGGRFSPTGPCGRPLGEEHQVTTKAKRVVYPSWFYIPAIALYVVFFAVPTFASFYFALTRWSLFDSAFIGFDNFAEFFRDPRLVSSFVHT